MNRRVHVEHPDGWVRGGGTAVRGTAFADGERVDATLLHECFAAVDDREGFRGVVDAHDGFYAAVRVVDGAVFAAVDHVRSVPLFYAPAAGVVSDSARWLRRTLDDSSMDPVAEAEYLSTTYVTGDETLYPGIRQLRAGDLLVLDTAGPDPAATTERHWTYAPGVDAAAPDRTPGERLAAFDAALVAAFERCLAVADGRPVAVPLSGGYDSRLVATMLVRLGYDDVRAFTYGRAETPDVRVAERVAAALDLPWRHVEYAPDDWYDWFASPERAAYYERADDFDAIPNLSAWPAVGRLRAEGWLPDDAVVVPGQTVAEISGHLPDRLLDADATTDGFVESVLERHYDGWARDDHLDRRFAARVRDVVDGLRDPADPASAYAAWEWQERQGKFLCSDGRIYEHWGLDWWFPLWDPAVADAWAAFPASARAGKRRYVEYVESLYARVAGVDRATAGRTHADEGWLRARVVTLRSAVDASPLADVLRPFYRYYRGRTDTRATGPLGHLGMLPPEQFDRLYAPGRRHHTFRALEALGRVSFVPVHERGWPGETLSVEALDRTRPASVPLDGSPPTTDRAPTVDGEGLVSGE